MSALSSPSLLPVPSMQAQMVMVESGRLLCPSGESWVLGEAELGDGRSLDSTQPPVSSKLNPPYFFFMRHKQHPSC